MKRLYKTLFLFLGIGLASVAKAQDPQFTQYYNAPSFLNPAFTGALGEQFVGAVNYRRQWPSLGTAYNTFVASFDYATADGIALGVQLLNDEAGEAGFKTSGASFITSYLIPISRRFNLQPAVQVGYYQRSVNFDQLVFVDEILFNSAVAAEGTGESTGFLNFSTGFLVYTNSFWLGFSAHNITNPIVVGGSEPLFLNQNIAQTQTKYSFHTGYNVALPDPDFGTFGSVLYKQQGNAQQLDVTLGLNYKAFSIGSGFRTFEDFNSDLTNRDALAFILGYNGYYLDQYNFNIAYSYDLTISGLSRFSGGAHEISMMVKMSNGNWLKAADKRRVFCPVVNRNIFMLKRQGTKVRNTHNRVNNRSGGKSNKFYKHNKKRNKRRW